MQVDIITVCYCGVPMAGVRSKESGNEGWQAARLLPIPAPSFEGQQNAAHANDGRFQPAADLRLSICELPPLWPLTEMRNEIRNGPLTQIKNHDDRSRNVYENTENDDKMSGEKTGFYTKMHPWREDQQESAGFLGRECISYTIRQDGRRQTVDGKRGETVGTRCRVSGAGASAERFAARGY